MFTKLSKTRPFALATLTAVVTLGSVATALPATATTPTTVELTTNCDAPLELTANVGDTIIITMTHPGCSGSEPSTENDFGYASVNNLNGTYSDGTANYPGTSTAAGFLDYVSATNGSYFADYYWSTPSSTDHDWSTLQTTDGGADAVVTTTLRATDGAGNALAVGSTVADIFKDAAPFIGDPGFDHGVVEYAITYAGGSADGAGTGTGTGSGTDAETAAPVLAHTGSDTTPYVLGAIALLALGLALRAGFARKREVVNN